MSHINSDTLQGLKVQYNRIHMLLKRYDEEQTVSEDELVNTLRDLKEEFASDIESWKSYLSYE
jgi:hypothetical protein